MSISIQAVETYLTLSKQTVWVQKLYIKDRFLEPQNNDLIVTWCDVRHLEKVLLDELFQNVTGVFTDDLAEFTQASDAGEDDETVWLQHGHAVVDVPHDDDLTVGGGDVRTRTGPVHVLQRHLQGLVPEELQPHFLILQDLLHGDQSVPWVLVLGQLRHTSQNHKIAFAEAGHHLVPRLARLAAMVPRERAGVLASFFGFEVVLVAFAAAVYERLALTLGSAVSPARFVCLARSLVDGKIARSGEFVPTGRHAGLVSIKVVAVFAAVAVGEGIAVVPLGVVKPTQLFLPTVFAIRHLKALLCWQTSGVWLGDWLLLNYR